MKCGWEFPPTPAAVRIGTTASDGEWFKVLCLHPQVCQGGASSGRHQIGNEFPMLEVIGLTIFGCLVFPQCSVLAPSRAVALCFCVCRCGPVLGCLWKGEMGLQTRCGVFGGRYLRPDSWRQWLVRLHCVRGVQLCALCRRNFAIFLGI